jgi:hypothetical protein
VNEDEVELYYSTAKMRDWHPAEPMMRQKDAYSECFPTDDLIPYQVVGPNWKRIENCACCHRLVEYYLLPLSYEGPGSFRSRHLSKISVAQDDSESYRSADIPSHHQRRCDVLR